MPVLGGFGTWVTGLCINEKLNIPLYTSKQTATYSKPRRFFCRWLGDVACLGKQRINQDLYACVVSDSTLEKAWSPHNLLIGRWLLSFFFGSIHIFPKSLIAILV